MNKLTLALSAIAMAIALASFVPRESTASNPATTVATITPTIPIVTNMAPTPKVDQSFEGPKSISRIAVNKDNTVFIMGEINETSIEIAQEITQKAQKSKELYVLINSPGGSVLDGAQIIAAIQASPAKVYTVCLQICASMGSIIHAYGSERLMLDRAILMNHQAALGLQGPIEIVRSRLSTLYRYTQKMDKFIAERAGLTLEQFNLVFSNEQWIDAEDATYQKFNDKIVHLDFSAFDEKEKHEIKNSLQQTKLKMKLGF